MTEPIPKKPGAAALDLVLFVLSRFCVALASKVSDFHRSVESPETTYRPVFDELIDMIRPSGANTCDWSIVIRPDQRTWTLLDQVTGLRGPWVGIPENPAFALNYVQLQRDAWRAGRFESAEDLMDFPYTAIPRTVETP